MSKVYVKVGNVFFASKWHTDRHGNLKEGEASVSSSKLVARVYSDVRTVMRDAAILGIALDKIEMEKVA